MKNKQRRNAEIEDMSVFEWQKQHRQQQRLISGSKAVHNYATKIKREINARAERQKTMKNTRIRDMSVRGWDKHNRLIDSWKALQNGVRRLEREIQAWKRSDAARIDREVNALVNGKDNRVPQFLMPKTPERGVER